MGQYVIDSCRISWTAVNCTANKIIYATELIKIINLARNPKWMDSYVAAG